MKLVYIIFPVLIAFNSCKGQENQPEKEEVDWALQLDYPTKDSLDKFCNVGIKEIQRIQKDALDGCDLYYFKEALYTGWACEIIPNNRHKYRYEQFKNGRMIRRISYYDNGKIDGDFRMKNCKNYGPSRMWLYNGNMYIDEFYISPGIKHGIQKQWHDNGALAKESRFDNGKLIYQKKFNRNGSLIN
jgi:hypothetical protein